MTTMLLAAACNRQGESGGRPKVVPGQAISGSGKVLSTSVIFHDDGGQLNIADLYLLVNDPAHGVDGANACVVWNKRSTGEVFLLDDAGKSWLGPHRAGTSTVLVNKQCLVSLNNTGLAEVS